ncbi:MAG: VOC family protein [Candidatus Methylomirabilales bacterium]
MSVRAMPGLPIRLGDVLQAGIVVRDLQASMEAYWRTLGIGPWKVYTYAPPMLREATLRGRPAEYAMRIAHAQAGPLQLELIQPLAGGSIFAEHLDAQGEGLHHIQSRVEDIEGVLAAFRRLGVGVLMSGKFGEGEFHFLDTGGLLGVVYEIFRRKSRPAPEAVYPPELAQQPGAGPPSASSGGC